MKLNISGAVVASICLYVVLPLAPVLAELIVKGRIDGVVLTLAASMYCIAVALSSKSIGVFGVSLLMGIIYALSYGVASGLSLSSPNAQPQPNAASDHLLIVDTIGIIAVAIIHAIERKRRHGDNNEKVIEFQ